jgi:hypothetical protein
MRRAIDTIFQKGLKRNVTETTSQAAGTAANLGDACPNRPALAVLDISAASGTTPSLTQEVEGSDDGSTWSAAGEGGAAFGAKTAAGRSFLSLKPFRQYRAAANTISGTTPSFTYSLMVIGMAARAAVVQS